MSKISPEDNHFLTGRTIYLREVDAEHDASLMIELRSNPSLTRFLPPLDTDLEKQRNWIASLQERSDDFMFAADTKQGHNTEGYLGIYSIRNNEAEWGRWVMREATPVALESVLLLHRFAFESLKLDRIFCRTIVDNEKVINFHDKYGASRSEIIKHSIRIGNKYFDMQEHEVTRALWLNILDKFSGLITNS